MKNLVLPMFTIFVLTIALGTANRANASIFQQSRPTPSPTFRPSAPGSQQKTTPTPATQPTPQSSSNSSALFLLTRGNEDYAAAEALISARQASQGSSEKLRSAINYYTRAIEADPKLARAYLQRAMSTALLYFNSAVELRKAITDLDTAINLQPTATAYYERAKVRTRLSRVDKSVTPSMVLSDLNDGLKRDAKFFPILNARAQVHFGMGNYALALADVNESLRLFSFQSPIVEFKKQIEAKIASGGTPGGEAANATNPTPTPAGTPAMKPPVYTWATAETLTSVTQVIDVKPTDSWYSPLQILIEKYGIVGLTEGKKLSPNQNLTPAAYRTIRQSARVQLQQVASRTGMLSRRFDELFPTNCPDPKAVADVITSGEVVNSVKCIFGPSTLKAVYPDRPMTRGYFVQVFEDAVENGSLKVASNSRGETGPTKTSATPAELKALIDQGQRLMGSKDYDGAIRMFNQVIEYDANYIEAYRLRGVSALSIYEQNPPMQGQKLYTALFNFDHAINRGSTNPDDYYLRGMTHVRMGSKEKGVADFRSALRMNPNHKGSKDELAKLGADAPATVPSTSGLAGPISEDILLGIWDVKATADGVTNSGTFQIQRENGKVVVAWVSQTSKTEVLLTSVTVTTFGSVVFKTGFSSYSFVGALDAARNKLAGAFTLTAGNQKLTGTWEARRRGTPGLGTASIYPNDEARFTQITIDLAAGKPVAPDDVAWAARYEQQKKLGVKPAPSVSSTSTSVPEGRSARGEFFDDFLDNRNKWGTGETSEFISAVADGKYQLRTKVFTFYTTILPFESVPKIDQTKDFTIETEFTVLSGQPTYPFSLLWGVTRGFKSRHAFGLMPNGTFFKGKSSETPWTEQVPARVSDAAKPGFNATNKLTVKKRGSSIEMYLNDVFVARYQFEAFDPDSTIGFQVNGDQAVSVNYLRILPQ